MRRPSQPFLATMIGLGASVFAMAFEFIAFPGMLVAALFWPQGVHSGAGIGAVTGVLYVGVLFFGTTAFWSLIAYALLRFTSRAHSSASAGIK